MIDLRRDKTFSIIEIESEEFGCAEATRRQAVEEFKFPAITNFKTEK